MRFAMDKLGERIKPVPQKDALCPLCQGIVISKCGEIYDWHWQHKNNLNCDSWQEHETVWHLQWKAKFPDTCQEVIIEKNGEKHIADVLTSGDLVIEFQNSSISTSTIRTREMFYGNMIWVVNADEFKDNFIITSNVNSALYKIDKKAKRQINSFEEQNEEKLEVLKEEIKVIEKSIADKGNKLKVMERKIESIKNIIFNLNAKVCEWIGKWSKNGNISETYIDDVLSLIRGEYKANLISIHNTIKENNELLEKNNQKVKDLLECEDYVNSNIRYKIVNSEEIKPKDYIQVRAISKNSRDELFPKIIEFNSEYELSYFKQRKDKYLFLINPSYYLERFKEQIEMAQENIIRQTQVFNKLKMEVFERVSTVLDLLLDSTIKELESLKIELNELNENKIIADETFSAINKEIIDLNLKYRRRIEEDIRVNRSTAMVSNRGKYSYQWKHERTTWRVATKPIFFDIGKEYLFERIGENEFKKIILEDFLTRYQ